jgi:hypothetical protein
MHAFYCSADGLGPFAPLDWRARAAAVGQAQADAERRSCASHLLANGGGPVVGSPITHGPDATAALVALGAVDAGGILTHASLPLGAAQLRCPECLAPVHVAESAPAWVPPAVEEPDPAAPVYVPLEGVTLQPLEVEVAGEQWQRIGGLRTAVVAWARKHGVELASTRAGFVAGVEAEGGALDLRLVEDPLDGSGPHALVEVTLPAGSYPVVEFKGAVAPAAGPCAYRIEARLNGAVRASVSEASLALYEVQS